MLLKWGSLIVPKLPIYGNSDYQPPSDYCSSTNLVPTSKESMPKNIPKIERNNKSNFPKNICLALL